MAECYQDCVTDEVFDRADLEAQYQEYVSELLTELPDVEPCSFKHWLRGELEDRLQRHRNPAGGHENGG